MTYVFGSNLLIDWREKEKLFGFVGAKEQRERKIRSTSRERKRR